MTNVIFEICDYNEFDPINGFHNPKGFIQRPVELKNFIFKRNDIIKPFLQDYEYLVIGADQIYNYVKIIPYNHWAKKSFEHQYKNIT